MLQPYASYLESIKIPLRLSVLTETGWPINLSLWFTYKDGLLYCATLKTAKLVKYLRHDSRCSFEIASDQIPYCGIRGQARATLDEQQGSQIIEDLLIRYLGKLDSKLAKLLLSRRKNEVAIILKPLKLFSWNFQDRMSDVSSIYREHFCP